MRFPKALPKNGTIGFVAPSFGCAIEPYKSAFDNALAKWSAAGYRTLLGPNCYAGSGIGISATPDECADELLEAYISDDSDVLISCGGGELMCETISKLDFEAITKANPKWYLGYSDNTNFTFLLNTICDVASVYGPCASSFGMENEHSSLRDAMNVLCLGNDNPTSASRSITIDGYDMWERVQIKDESNPLAGYNLDTKSHVRAYMPHGEQYVIGKTMEVEQVTMQGRLVGGCLDCLVNLCGTRFDNVHEFNKKYKDDGIIWFIEACDLNPMSVRRAMWELEEAGWFENTAGFIIGRPRLYDEELMGLDHYKAVYDVISHYEVPVIMDADLGHLPPAVPIIGGALAKVSADNGSWKIRMELA